MASVGYPYPAGENKDGMLTLKRDVASPHPSGGGGVEVWSTARQQVKPDSPEKDINVIGFHYRYLKAT
jgi:hypothetical protein